MDRAARSLDLPRTAATNYRQGRGRPASSSAPRRATADQWTTNREEELEHHAALIPRAFAEPVPKAIGLESYKHRDLLASHARRVSTAAQKGRTDQDSAVLASSVVRWQLQHRELASRASQSRRAAHSASSSSRPRTAAGFVHYVPETPAEDRMNARWQQHREEEIVMARNDIAVKRALAQWAAQKQQLEQEITRRIENRRRPLSATTARGLHFSRGIQGIIEPPNTAGLQDTLSAVQTQHLDTDSESEQSHSDHEEGADGGTTRAGHEQKASANGLQSRASSQNWRESSSNPAEQGRAWRPSGTAPAGASRGGTAARRTRFSPQAVRPVTAATVASMGSVGTSDTSAALHRQRLRVPVLVPRSRGVAADEEEAAQSLGMMQATPSMGGTWAGAASGSGGGLQVTTAGGAMQWPHVAADAGVGSGNRPPARIIATPMFRGRGQREDAAAVSLPAPPLEGEASIKSKGGSPRAKKAARGGAFSKNEGPPPKYDQRVAKQEWGGGMHSVVSRAPTPASLTPLELAMSRQAARNNNATDAQGDAALQAEVESTLQVFRSKGFAVTRKAVERAILLTPGDVKPIEADFGLMKLRSDDSTARAGTAAGATRGSSSKGSSRPGTAPASAKGVKGGKKAPKPKKLPFVSYGLHQMDVSGSGPAIAAASRFLPENPLEDLARALAVSTQAFLLSASWSVPLCVQCSVFTFFFTVCRVPTPRARRRRARRGAQKRSDPSPVPRLCKNMQLIQVYFWSAICSMLSRV